MSMCCKLVRVLHTHTCVCTHTHMCVCVHCSTVPNYGAWLPWLGCLVVTHTTRVRLLYLTKGTLNDGILAGISKLRHHVPLTNRRKCRQTLQLDVVIYLALEFAIRRHLTVDISASADLHPRVPRVPRAVIANTRVC